MAHRVLPVLVRCNPHEQFRSCKSVCPLAWLDLERDRAQMPADAMSRVQYRKNAMQPPSCCPRSRTPYTMDAPETPPPSVAVAQGGTNVGSAGNHGPYKCGGGGKRATNPPRFLAPRGQPAGSGRHCNRRGGRDRSDTAGLRVSRPRPFVRGRVLDDSCVSLACCRAAQRLPQSTACMQMHCPRQAPGPSLVTGCPKESSFPRLRPSGCGCLALSPLPWRCHVGPPGAAMILRAAEAG